MLGDELNLSGNRNYQKLSKYSDELRAKFTLPSTGEQTDVIAVSRIKGDRIKHMVSRSDDTVKSRLDAG